MVIQDRRNGCRVLENNEAQGCAPYPSDFDGGSRNFGYQSLASSLELVDVLPEVIDFPALAPILRAFNGADSRLETIGCGPGSFDRAGSFYAGTYIHVVFRKIELNQDKRNHLSLAIEVADLWDPLPGTGIDLIVDPLAHLFALSPVWALKIEICGRAPTMGGAWKKASEAASQLAKIAAQVVVG